MIESSDEVLILAEDIFFDLVQENLTEALMALLQKHPDALCLEVQAAFSSWQDLIYEEPLENEFIEVRVFVDASLSALAEDVVLATMLLSIDPDDKECHIQWP